MNDSNGLNGIPPWAIPDKSTRYPKLKEFQKLLDADNGDLSYGLSCEVKPMNALYYDPQIPQIPEMISDAHGKLRKILMTYPYTGNDEFKYRDIFTSFLKSLPKYTKVYLLGNIAQKKKEEKDSKKIWDKLFEELRAIREKIKFKEDRLVVINPQNIQGFSIWAQDPFIPVLDPEANDGHIYLIEPIKFKEAEGTDGDRMINGDSAIADCLAVANCFEGLCTNQSRVCLFFQGGNVLAGDDFLLVGQDDINKTKALFGTCFSADGILLPNHPDPINADDSGVHRAFQYVFGQKKMMIPIGFDYRLKFPKNKAFKDKFYCKGEFQPFYHLDLFITPAGYLFDEPYYTLILAAPFNASAKGDPIADEWLIRPMNHWLLDIKMHLENIRIDGKRKFIVRSMPMPVYPKKSGNKRSWIPLSYNNCLVEITKHSRKVWVPQYADTEEESQLEEYDNLALQYWQNHGFTAIPVDGCFPLIRRGGSIRCITKCLHRSEK
ncbi:MAG: hypothetical protein DHS20C18_26700 [Saprospiraceae bacterium]|nr:MAG: hypothetical protein DHS20C18_26700 [Saprospiraceae bacterium]